MNLIKKANPNNIFETKFSDTGWFLIIFLSIAICAFFERLIYDLGRIYGESGETLPYFQDAKTISIHAIIIILFLIISLSINYFLAERKSKYAIILVPYFVVSCILAIQLAVQTGVYFYFNHTNFQFYLAMSILVFVLTYGMYYIQNSLRRKNNNISAPTLKTLPIALFIILVGFVLLTLVFTKQKVNKNTALPPVAINSLDAFSAENTYYKLIEQKQFTTISDPNNIEELPAFAVNGLPSLPTISLWASASQIKDSLEVPRVALWWGSVNSAYNISTKTWVVDPGAYGANVDVLAYCRRWYPETVSTKKYRVETVPQYNNTQYELVGSWDSWTWECIQP